MYEEPGILGPIQNCPGPPRNIKTTFGWFFNACSEVDNVLVVGSYKWGWAILSDRSNYE
jgi:hypothetical protein